MIEKKDKRKLVPIADPSTNEITAMPQQKITLGTRFAIGLPKNGTYQFLMQSFSSIQGVTKKLLPVKSLEGTLVITKGILKLKNGRTYLSLERADRTPYYEGVNRIYADLSGSLQARELIGL